MDRLNAMRVFTRIVESGGFAKAADSLQMPRASVTILIKQLEAHLGVQLLQRTTRHISLTLDGAAYYPRCVRLLADLEETEAVFSAARHNPKGLLRVDMPAGIGRLIVIPALPQFTARYPQIELEISLNDRTVDLIREGVDCVLRAAHRWMSHWWRGRWSCSIRSPVPAPITCSVMACPGARRICRVIRWWSISPPLPVRASAWSLWSRGRCSRSICPGRCRSTAPMGTWRRVRPGTGWSRPRTTTLHGNWTRAPVRGAQGRAATGHAADGAVPATPPVIPAGAGVCRLAG